MENRSQLVVALVIGTLVSLVNMVLIDRLFWSHCGGIDIHRWPQIWVCWHIGELQVAGSIVAGTITGLLSRRRGFAIGTLVALGGLSLFTLVVRYPFGSDHLATLRQGLLFYVLPSVLACIVAARLRGSTWKHAL